MNRLTFIPEERLQQGSEPWLKRRMIVGTATQCAPVVGFPMPYDDSPQTWRQLRSERAFGSTFKGNPDSERGKMLEPFARNLFNRLYHNSVEPMEPVWCERRLNDERSGSTHLKESEPLPDIEGPTIASSYDGYSLNGDYHAWLEIKCPRNERSKVWKAVKAGKIPDDYYWQVVHQRATFGDHMTFGYFMAYLDDENYQIMSIHEDSRVESGQFDKDVRYAESCWKQFLEGQPQPGDMSDVDGWAELENQLTAGRTKRVEIEAAAKPHKDAEELAKKSLKKMIAENCGEGTGLRRIHGRNVSFDNRPKTSFDMESFHNDNPDFDLEPYQKVVVSYDTDRLVAEFPELAGLYVEVTDSWWAKVK